MRKSDSVVKQQKASSHLSGLEIVLNQMVTIDRSRTMEELNRAIQGILEYIGEYTKAGRAYTFEFIEKQSIYRNTQCYNQKNGHISIECILYLSEKIFVYCISHRCSPTIQ